MCSSNLSDTANMSRHGSTLCSPTAEKKNPRPGAAQHSLKPNKFPLYSDSSPPGKGAVLAMYQMLLRGAKPKRELYYTDLRLITQEMLSREIAFSDLQ